MLNLFIKKNVGAYTMLGLDPTPRIPEAWCLVNFLWISGLSRVSKRRNRCVLHTVSNEQLYFSRQT